MLVRRGSLQHRGNSMPYQSIQQQQRGLEKPVDSARPLFVAKLRIVDAETDHPVKHLDPLVNGAVIDIARIGTRNLTIEAVAAAAAATAGGDHQHIAYIQWKMDGREDTVQTERVAPYTMCGGKGRDLFACHTKSPLYFEVGSVCRVTATAYGRDGTVGNSLSFWYRVEDSSTFPPFPMDDDANMEITGMKFVLVDADTDQDVYPLYDRVMIDMNIFPRINVRADVMDRSFPTASVVFQIGPDVVRIENHPPYALHGNIGPNYLPWTPTEVGMTYIQATAYSEKGGKGIMGPTGAVSVLILTPFSN
jgi:hypothetical protein